MRCVVVAGDGSMTATGASSCTGSEFVLLTQSELDFYTASPFRMSVADGAALSGLIVGVWVTALICRYWARVVFGDAESS
jgi:hypothetical protein